MARWVRLPDILVRRARGWAATGVERTDARHKLDHITQVALGQISRRDQQAMTTISPSAERLSHDSTETPSDSPRH